MLPTLHCEKPDGVVCGYRCFESPDFICRTLPYSLCILPKINKWLEFHLSHLLPIVLPLSLLFLLSGMPFLLFVFSASCPPANPSEDRLQFFNSPMLQMRSDRKQGCLVGYIRARSQKTGFLLPLPPGVKQRTGGHVSQVNPEVKIKISRKLWPLQRSRQEEEPRKRTEVSGTENS